jgi:hypothetical protein
MTTPSSQFLQTAGIKDTSLNNILGPLNHKALTRPLTTTYIAQSVSFRTFF